MHRLLTIHILLFLICLAACVPASPAIPTALGPAISTTRPPVVQAAAATHTPAPAVPATVTFTVTPRPSATSDFRAEMRQLVQPEPWLGWVRQLSGAEPVQLNGKAVTLSTRFTPAMFASGAKNTAFDYLLATLRGWYPETQITVQPYEMKMHSGDVLRGKNLILDLPGVTAPGEVIVLSAHLDSRADLEGSMSLAPGADDNASGSAALLEAARLFRERHFARTLRLIWFTGEEQGLLGSQAYIALLKSPSGIKADINLDMFGYRGDGPGCVEIHAGQETGSEPLARHFIDAYTAVGSDTALVGSEAALPGGAQTDLLTTQATGGSDHSSFWAIGVPAIEISENIFGHPEVTPSAATPAGTPAAGEPAAGCIIPAMNPNYHSAKDTVSGIDAAYAIRIVRAALITAGELAGPRP